MSVVGIRMKLYSCSQKKLYTKSNNISDLRPQRSHMFQNCHLVDEHRMQYSILAVAMTELVLSPTPR